MPCQTQVRGMPGPFFFSLVLLSLKPSGAMGGAVLSWLIEQCVLGLLITCSPVGLFCNYLIIQRPKHDHSRQINRRPSQDAGCSEHLPNRSLRAAPCQEPQPSGQAKYTASPRTGAYAMTLKASLLDSCSSSRSRRECWI